MDGRGLEEALVLVAQCFDSAFAREVGGVEEDLCVWWVAGHEGFFEELYYGRLEGDDLALELGLGNHCNTMTC